ncbi:MAG TPA: hypothetical protein VII94_01835, partial [Candidatus Saccharimonadales bacterium]
TSEGIDGLKVPDLAYLAASQLAIRQKTEGKDNAVFASINRVQILSLRRLGLQVELLMGRDNFITSEASLGKNYTPIMIPYNEQNVELFKAMDYIVPEINLT